MHVLFKANVFFVCLPIRDDMIYIEYYFFRVEACIWSSKAPGWAASGKCFSVSESLCDVTYSVRRPGQDKCSHGSSGARSWWQRHSSQTQLCNTHRKTSSGTSQVLYNSALSINSSCTPQSDMDNLSVDVSHSLYTYNLQIFIETCPRGYLKWSVPVIQ